MRYTHDDYPGVALYISGEPSAESCPICEGWGGWTHSEDDDEWDDCTHCDGTGQVQSEGWAYVTMVGDDRQILVETSELSPLDDDAYCTICGQIGCTADGR